MYGVEELKRAEPTSKRVRPVLVQRLGWTFGVSYNKNPVYILEAISIFASLIRPFPN